eukprot:5174237-Pleurochrysis_carterae.AAC.9
MPTVNVFGTRMVFGVVGQIDGRHVVHGKRRRRNVADTQLLEQRPEVHGLLGRLGCSDDFCFARRGRYGGLLFRRPRDGCLAVEEDVARSGVPRRPVGIRVPMHHVARDCDIAKSNVLVQGEIHKDSAGRRQELWRGATHSAT